MAISTAMNLLMVGGPFALILWGLRAPRLSGQR